MRLPSACLTAIAIMAISAPALGENWSQFRGPGGSGLPSESRLPSQWGPEQNIAWKVKLPGVAWSQPVVWGNKIFVTTAVTENQPVPSVGQAGGGGGRGRGPGGFGRGGEGRGGEGRGGEGRGGEGRGDGAPGTQPGAAPADDSAKAASGDDKSSRRPDVDRAAKEKADAPRGAGPGGPRRGGRGPGGGGGRGAAPPDQVYRWMVMCLDRDSGKVLWEQLAHEGKPTLAIHRTNTYASETPVTDGERVYAYFGMTGLYCYDLDGKLLWNKSLGSYPMMMGWGTGSSPVLAGDRLFVQCDNEQESFLIALDKRTGEELWRVARQERSNWSTPFVWKNKERTELVAAGSTMRSYDPADGHLLWELGDIRGRCSASPVATDELLYVGVGGGMGGAGPLVAIRAGASGDITLASGEKSNAGVAWVTPKAGPPMASPLVYKDRLYVLDQRGGIIGCYNAKTGEQLFRQRIEGAKGFTASPWAYDGKIYCLDEDGQAFVLEAGPELKVLSTNKLDDSFWSSVAIAGDHLLLRGVNYLYSIAP